MEVLCANTCRCHTLPLAARNTAHHGIINHSVCSALQAKQLDHDVHLAAMNQRVGAEFSSCDVHAWQDQPGMATEDTARKGWHMAGNCSKPPCSSYRDLTAGSLICCSRSCSSAASSSDVSSASPLPSESDFRAAPLPQGQYALQKVCIGHSFAHGAILQCRNKCPHPKQRDDSKHLPLPRDVCSFFACMIGE